MARDEHLPLPVKERPRTPEPAGNSAAEADVPIEVIQSDVNAFLEESRQSDVAAPPKRHNVSDDILPMEVLLAKFQEVGAELGLTQKDQDVFVTAVALVTALAAENAGHALGSEITKILEKLEDPGSEALLHQAFRIASLVQTLAVQKAELAGTAPCTKERLAAAPRIVGTHERVREQSVDIAKLLNDALVRDPGI